jgi:hypothetical protein
MPRGKTENLVPLTTAKAREIGRKGGKKSVEARREKKLMSQIYGAFLAEKHKVKIEGEWKEITGEQYLAAVMNKVFGAGGAPAVSLMKEIREATEGSKVAITDPDGGPFGVSLLSHDEALARLAELRVKQDA